MQEISHLVIKVTSDDVATATKSLDGMSKATDRLMSLLKGLVTAAAALAVFKQAASAIGEFDVQMSGVLAVTEATTKEMKKLTDQARELGGTTRFSAQEAAAGMKFLGQAGFSTEQIMAAMPGMLELATAGEMDLASAADIASGALAGFRLRADEVTRVADALAVAAAQTNTDVFQMGDALKYVAPIAATLKMSIEETSAALGILSNANIKGSMAGTGLRQVLSSLAAPTREAIDTMRVYGIELDRVNPATNSLSDILTHLRDKGLDAAGAFTLFGDRGAPAVLALTNQVPELLKLNKALENSHGQAKRMADIMGDNLPGDFLKLKSATNELFLALGDAGLRDVLRDCTQGTTDLIRAMSDMVKSGEAAAWVDLVTLKLSFLTDGFDNASENIATVWAMTMEYITGDGKEAADDIANAFKNMPENIRMLVQGTSAIFAGMYQAWEATSQAMRNAMVAHWEFVLNTLKNVGDEIVDQLKSPFLEFGIFLRQAQIDTAKAINKLLPGRYSDQWFAPLEADIEKWKSDLAATNNDFLAKQTALVVGYVQQQGTIGRDLISQYGSIIEAVEEAITAALNERDVNVAASDAKIKKIQELRDAYAALKAARDEAAKNPQPSTPPPGGGGGDLPSHFDPQAFDRLRQQLQAEEKTVQESYDRRLDLIRRNTQAGSDLRLELEAALNDQLSVEMDAAHDQHFERLTSQYAAEQNALQMALDTRQITEEQFQQRSQDKWSAYTKSIQGISVTGSQNLARIQMGMMANVLGMASDIASQMADMAGEGTAAQKALFVVSKGIAIAQAIIMTNLASIAALAPPPIGLGPIAGLPYSAAIKALGYASAGLMAATTVMEVSKHEHGGMIGAGKFGLVGESGMPELVKGPAVVTSARATADMGLGGGRENKPVIFQVINTVPGIEFEKGKETETDDAKTVEVIVRKAAERVAGDIVSGAGPVTRALTGAYSLRRTA